MRARYAHNFTCAAFMLLSILVASALLVLFPIRAYADTNYTIDELSTELTVNPDSSVHVNARQVITFNGQNSGYIWYLYRPGVDESVKINNITVTPVDDGGTPTDGYTRLQMFDVNVSRQGEGPGDNANLELRRPNTQPWYSYSLSDGMIRSYFPAANGSYMIETDYTITNCVQVYRDIADLSWRYAHASMPVDMGDVTLQVVLPKPDGASFAAGEDVMVWGHGQEDATIAIEQDGTVLCHLEHLQTGHYSEAHIIFPASWMTEMSSNAPHLYTEVHKPTVIQDEGQWVDSYSRGARWDYQVRMLFFLLAAIVLLVGVVYTLRVGFNCRSRRALIRVAATIGVLALVCQLVFAESLTVYMLAGVALVVAVASQFVPNLLPNEIASEEDVPDVGDGADVADEAYTAEGDGVEVVDEADAADEGDMADMADESDEAEVPDDVDAVEAPDEPDEDAPDAVDAVDETSEVDEASEEHGGEDREGALHE